VFLFHFYVAKIHADLLPRALSVGSQFFVELVLVHPKSLLIMTVRAVYDAIRALFVAYGTKFVTIASLLHEGHSFTRRRNS
jgi:hypothetical protein